MAIRDMSYGRKICPQGPSFKRGKNLAMKAGERVRMRAEGKWGGDAVCVVAKRFGGPLGLPRGKGD